MRHINGVYTQRFNRHHGIDGQLFRGRYKAVLVDADSYLLEVLRYIHRNPLQAGIADTLHDFAWSSHHGYLSSAKKWKWLQKDTLLAMLSPIQSRRRSAYLNFVSAGAPAEIEQFYALKNLPSLLGADAFKEWVREKFDQIKFHREIPESRELSPAPEKIINAVCTYFKTDKLRLLTSRRGTENLPRDIAIYLVRRRCRETLATVGRHFAIHNYSTVSSAIERIEARKINDQSLQNHLKKLEIMLAKSQKQT